MAGSAGARAGSRPAPRCRCGRRSSARCGSRARPRENHWWHVALYLTARGLTTSPIPDGSRAFQIDFDFLDHRLVIATSDGRREDDAARLAAAAGVLRRVLRRGSPRSASTSRSGRCRSRSSTPCRSPRTRGHSEYRPEIAERLWRILAHRRHGARSASAAASSARRARSHFFWGSFDLADDALLRARRAPEHPGGVPNLADWVTREAYSHEVWSAGFWPGTRRRLRAPGLLRLRLSGAARLRRRASVEPAAASYSPTLREFLLPYDEVRALARPGGGRRRTSCRATYEAAADARRMAARELERQTRRAEQRLHACTARIAVARHARLCPGRGLATPVARADIRHRPAARMRGERHPQGIGGAWNISSSSSSTG